MCDYNYNGNVDTLLGTLTVAKETMHWMKLYTLNTIHDWLDAIEIWLIKF